MIFTNEFGYTVSQAIKSLVRFADEDLADEILRNGFTDLFQYGVVPKRKKRIMLKALKKAADLRFQAMIIRDPVFMDNVVRLGYVESIRLSPLAGELRVLGDLGEHVFESLLAEFTIKQQRRRTRQAKKLRAENRRKQAGTVKLLARSQIRRDKIRTRQRIRNEKARANQKGKAEKVRQRPFELVLMSANFADLEEAVFDPVTNGDNPKLRSGTSMAFSVHLGKYVDGGLDGACLVGGNYVGGADLRIVCHWDKSKSGPEAFRFVVKSIRGNNGSCHKWGGSQVRAIDHLPKKLQFVLKQALHRDTPHLVSGIPNNILQFAV